jgi:hypothetical protein
VTTQRDIEAAKKDIDACHDRLRDLVALPRKDRESKAAWNVAVMDAIDAAWKYATLIEKTKEA